MAHQLGLWAIISIPSFSANSFLLHDACSYLALSRTLLPNQVDLWQIRAIQRTGRIPITDIGQVGITIAAFIQGIMFLKLKSLDFGMMRD